MAIYIKTLKVNPKYRERSNLIKYTRTKNKKIRKIIIPDLPIFCPFFKNKNIPHPKGINKDNGFMKITAEPDENIIISKVKI